MNDFDLKRIERIEKQLEIINERIYELVSRVAFLEGKTETPKK